VRHRSLDVACAIEASRQYKVRRGLLRRIHRAGQDRLGFAPRAGEIAGGEALSRVFAPVGGGSASHQAVSSSAVG
jgi:hypothetical protein